MNTNRLKPHSINSDRHFIAGWYLEDTSICDEMIQHFKDSPNQEQGKMSIGYDPKLKKSTDVHLPLNTELWNKFSTVVLSPATMEYMNLYEYCNYYAPWTDVCGPNIQYYAPGDGFYAWHTERSCARNDRHLTYILYLNDVTEGGETEFYHQDLKVKPEKGLIIIFPVDWTHTHRGAPSVTQEKYITTGWFNYVG